MPSAEENSKWVRNRVKAFGMEAEVSRLAYTRYLARHAPDSLINHLFNEIVWRPGD